MTRMIPDRIGSNTESRAERKIFQRIRDCESLDHYICLHSLLLADHPDKTSSEVDFIMLGPEGVFCLEVKGGRVEKKDGKWIFTDSYNQSHVKIEGPFEQAKSAHHQVRQDLIEEFDWFRSKCIGYGVIFPDIEFTHESPEWDLEIVYDLEYLNRSFDEYFLTLSDFWNKGKFGGSKDQLTSQEIQQIRNFLRPDFENIVPLQNKLERAESAIDELTDEQYEALDQMSENNRVLFNGSAGTGKTLLAVEKAKNLIADEKRVLFLCFNRTLAGHLKTHFDTADNDGELVVDSLHRYFHSIISRAGLEEQLDYWRDNVDSDVFYTKKYSEVFMDSLNVIDEQFDAMVIDEGQDILNQNYFIALDNVLSGGIAEGEWYIFYDSNYQSSVYDRFDEEFVNDLKENNPVLKLTTNCRNTRPIASQTHILTEFPMAETKIDEGELVEFVKFSDLNDQKTKLKNKLTQLISEGVSPGEITILFTEDNESIVKKLLGKGHTLDFVKVTNETVDDLSDDRVRYSTVQSYKGLENKVIILMDIDELDGEYTRSVNYVGMTRARSKLLVFVKEALFDQDISQRVKETMKRESLS